MKEKMHIYFKTLDLMNEFTVPRHELSLDKYTVRMTGQSYYHAIVFGTSYKISEETYNTLQKELTT